MTALSLTPRTSEVRGEPYASVYSFFQLWDAWQWTTPVMLTPIVDEGHGLRVWDERINKAERFQLMKIITPVGGGGAGMG